MIPGADGTSETSRAHVPAARATVLCMYDSTALTSPGGLPSPRPNEAFSRPSPRAGSRRWTSKTSSALAARPDACCPPCMPTPNGPPPSQIARSTTSPAPPIRPPHKQVPDLVAVDHFLFWKPGRLMDFQTARAYSVHQQLQHRIHMRARESTAWARKMCRPRFSCIAGEVSNVASLAPQTGMQREPGQEPPFKTGVN